MTTENLGLLIGFGGFVGAGAMVIIMTMIGRAAFRAEWMMTAVAISIAAMGGMYAVSEFVP